MDSLSSGKSGQPEARSRSRPLVPFGTLGARDDVCRSIDRLWGLFEYVHRRARRRLRPHPSATWTSCSKFLSTSRTTPWRRSQGRYRRRNPLRFRRNQSLLDSALYLWPCIEGDSGPGQSCPAPRRVRTGAGGTLHLSVPAWGFASGVGRSSRIFFK